MEEVLEHLARRLLLLLLPAGLVTLEDLARPVLVLANDGWLAGSFRVH